MSAAQVVEAVYVFEEFDVAEGLPVVPPDRFGFRRSAAWWRPADLDGYVQRMQSRILLHAVADGPAHHAP